jgi:hypothetical protein
MGFLDTAFARFSQEFPGTKQEGICRDGYGTYAFRIRRPDGRAYLFCAKNSFDANGLTVSCHKALVNDSMRFKMPIVMVLKKNAYLFFPFDITASKPTVNIRNNAEMLNFPLTAGRNLKTIGKKSVAVSPKEKFLVDQLGLEFIAA